MSKVDNKDKDKMQTEVTDPRKKTVNQINAKKVVAQAEEVLANTVRSLSFQPAVA